MAFQASAIVPRSSDSARLHTLQLGWDDEDDTLIHIRVHATPETVECIKTGNFPIRDNAASMKLAYFGTPSVRLDNGKWTEHEPIRIGGVNDTDQLVRCSIVMWADREYKDGQRVLAERKLAKDQTPPASTGESTSDIA